VCKVCAPELPGFWRHETSDVPSHQAPAGVMVAGKAVGAVATTGVVLPVSESPWQ